MNPDRNLIMYYGSVKTPSEALVYMTECTLATCEDLAGKKSRSKTEYSRQIEIAQRGVDWIKSMNITVTDGERVSDIINDKITVKQYCKKYEV